MVESKMSKKNSIITKTVRSSLVALLAASAVACSSSGRVAAPAPVEPSVGSVDDPFAGIEQKLTALATPCTFVTATGVMTVTVGDDETVVISKRATDSAIVQN